MQGAGLAEQFIEQFHQSAPELEVIYERGSLEKSAKKVQGKKQKRAPVTATGIV